MEVRGIRDVQHWFLEKCALDSGLTGSFLTSPGPNLEKQALCLFDFLTNFGTFEDTVTIFYLSMPFGLRKY